jgi:trigger factor
MHNERVVVETLSPVRKRVQVEVPASEVQSELDRAFSTVGREARIRGFRQGRVPRAVLERMFGEQIRREVLGRLVEHSFHHAIESEKLDVVGQPEIDADGITPGEDLKYTATVDIRPIITLGDTSGIEVTRPIYEVTDAEVDEVLASLREQAAELRPIEDRAVVEAGDVVVMNVGSTLGGGQPQRREGALVEAGSGSFPLALERQLVGQRKGVPVTLDVPYPEDYGNASLAGKTVQFEVEVVELKAKELPPLDDDFARDHGRAESLDDLRGKIRADLESQASARADAAVQDALLDQLIGRHGFEVPASLVDRRCDALLSAFDVRIPEGPEGAQLLDRLRTDVRPRAERDVRADLVLDAIATARGVTIDDTALDAEIDTLAKRQQQAPERIRAFYDRPEARHALRSRLGRDRTLSLVLAEAKVTARPMPKDVARAG